MRRTTSFALALSLVLGTALVSAAPTGAKETELAGCTPGYWKHEHHFGNWMAPYDSTNQFSDHFDYAFPGMTLLDVLWQGGGGLKALGRHTVAALLHATVFEGLSVPLLLRGTAVAR